MKYPPYPHYKPSRVEWLGEVPEHWEVERLGWHIDLVTGFPFKSDLFSFGDGIRLVRGDNVTEGQLRWGDKARFWNETINGLGPYFLDDGDLLIGMDGSKVGKNYAVVTERDLPLLLVQRVARLRAAGSIDNGLLFQMIGSPLFRTWVELTKTDPAIPHISPHDIRSFPIPLPPPPEQRAIAAFLDAQTTKLDLLTAKRRALIERLNEKRTALISRAVTRGLPPDAATVAGFDPHPKLKPSGIEWLGDVPEHWATPPLYTRYSVDLGKMLNEDRITGDHLLSYLRNVDVQWDRINFDDLPEMDVLPAERGRYTVRGGDLLVCEGGEVGRSALVPATVTDCAYQKALHRLRPARRDEVPRFMFYVLSWASHQGVFIAEGNPNTIPHLTGEQLRRYRFPAPPFEEQRAIAHYLDLETAKIEQLVAKVEAAIECLQEYRTALITAAVTGKIDVRGLATVPAQAGPQTVTEAGRRNIPNTV